MAIDNREFDERIRALEREQQQIQHRHTSPDACAQDALLKLNKIEINMAQQDKTLAKIDACVNGNGKPGLNSRMDVLERRSAFWARVLWIIFTPLIVAVVVLLVRALFLADTAAHNDETHQQDEIRMKRMEAATRPW